MSDPVSRAQALRDDILRHRPDMDAARRIPDGLAVAMRDAGLFRLLVPAPYGGSEIAPAAFVETLERLAEVDASVGWVAMIGATTGLLAAYLDPVEARTIFANPDTIATGVFAPTGTATIEGNEFRVNGRWKWNSGGQVSTWLGGGCVIVEDGKPRLTASGAPEHRMVLFPSSAATLIDTWHTTGLRGTGSGEMVVQDVVVPRSRAVSLIDDAPRIDGPLYKFPLFGLLAVGIAAVAGGNAKGALADFKTMARARRMPNGRSFAERSSTAQSFAEITAAIDAPRAFLMLEVANAGREAHSGAPLSIERRARLRLAATHLTRSAADAVRRLQDLAGGSAVFLADPLQRRLADAQAMTAHLMIAPATHELAGAVLLGNSVDTRQL